MSEPCMTGDAIKSFVAQTRELVMAQTALKAALIREERLRAVVARVSALAESWVAMEADNSPLGVLQGSELAEQYRRADMHDDRCVRVHPDCFVLAIRNALEEKS